MSQFDPNNPAVVGPAVVVNQVPQNALSTFNDISNTGIQTKFTMEVTTGDLVGIAVAEAEKQIRSRVAQLQRELGTANTQMNDLTGQRDTFLKTWCEDQATKDTRVAALVASAGAYLGKPPTINHAVATYSERSGNLSARLSITGKDFQFAWEYEDAAPQMYKDLLRSIEAQQKTVEALQRDILSARSALNNVDALERQARASIASQMAGRNEIGKQLVDAIRGTVNAEGLIEHLRV